MSEQPSENPELGIPPRPSEMEDEFEAALDRAESFEDVRWLVWLYDALETEEWRDARWRAAVLSHKGYGSLVYAVDYHYGRWLSDAARPDPDKVVSE